MTLRLEHRTLLVKDFFILEMVKVQPRISLRRGKIRVLMIVGGLV